MALSSASSETVRTDAPCSPVVEGTRGNVTITFTGGCTQGILPAQLQQIVDDILNKRTVSLEIFQELSQRFGVSDMAITTFFRTLGERKIPIEDLDSKLREIAARHLTLLKQIESLSGDDPQVEALKKDAVVAIRVGNYARAETLLLQAFDADLVAARKAQDAANSRFVTAAKTKADLGELKLSQLQYEAAAREFQTAADLVPASELGLRAQYLTRIGKAASTVGLYPRAEQALTEALRIREKLLPADNSDVADSLERLAWLYITLGRYTEAEPLAKRAVVIGEKTLGPEHREVAFSLNTLAWSYQKRGRYTEAEPLYKRALAIVEKALGPEHSDVASPLNNLATLYHAQGRYAEAEPLAKRALTIREKALGPEHPDVGTLLNNLAEFVRMQGRRAEAEPLYKRALAIAEKALGPEHPDVGQRLHNLAVLNMDRGLYAEAEPSFKRGLIIFEKALGLEHPDIAVYLSNQAKLYRLQGRYAEAGPLYKRALAIREKVYGIGHPMTEATRDDLQILRRLENPPDDYDLPDEHSGAGSR
ncbi:MAG TPA: tetratricopeptide repeat protein [Geminicoccaceae bacterium]|nr:tetratricopeptide repeat protein [Geminicoccaceae bacterium]